MFSTSRHVASFFVYRPSANIYLDFEYFMVNDFGIFEPRKIDEEPIYTQLT
jgi:hypothetical protein